jgi:alcohol dehydrogenase
MNAAYFAQFQGPITIQVLPDPTPKPHGVVLQVKATGLCRSDWHGWMGHDSDITLPHVPGHEFAGIIVAVGAAVQHWKKGDRVTTPFVAGCGTCPQCSAGHHQVCDFQSQPGFTHWGSFAEYVAVDFADTNLVRLPEHMSFETAASLGCRFATSFRGVVDQGRVRGGEWVAVHGCGGVGLSAIMIAKAMGAQVIAIDINPDQLAFAKTLGAIYTIDAKAVSDVVEAVKAQSGGGVHLSVDALGHPDTCFNSIANLRKRGRHVQIGLMTGDHRHPSLPMDQVIAHELEIYGSHGMQAYRYPDMLAMIERGALHPEQLIQNYAMLSDIPELLPKMDEFGQTGITVVQL